LYRVFAGKTFETWPEMIDNVIPYIGGEEEKSEKEPLKLIFQYHLLRPLQQCFSYFQE